MTSPQPAGIADTTRVYAHLSRLREQQGGYRHPRDCTARTGWLARGVYFFFQTGKIRVGSDGVARCRRDAGTLPLRYSP